MELYNDYRTNLEKAVLNKCNELGIEVIEQWPCAGFILDFVVSGQSIILEADGPCHDTPEGRKKKHYRDKKLRYMGWKHIIHLNQQQILDDEYLTKKLTKVIGLFE